MKVRFTILGCGSSLGIPRIDGYFGNCNPKIKENYRTRCSALISVKNFNILIDSSPDIKQQLIKSKVKNIDKVFYTHMHADQTHGINELRVFYLKNSKKINIYADKLTSKYLKENFKYCFKKTFDYPAILKINKLNKLHKYKIGKETLNIESIPVKHGKIKSILYKINDKCAYVSDVSEIYKKDYKKLKNLNYLILDCLRYNYHPSHFNLDSALKLIEIIKPKKTILTNLANDIDYIKIQKFLPNNVKPAYDGMNFLI
tara:strand:- start:153 stop:926 length:774 start_codon:yes stop_codon:yes gene_type:complete